MNHNFFFQLSIYMLYLYNVNNMDKLKPNKKCMIKQIINKLYKFLTTNIMEVKISKILVKVERCHYFFCRILFVLYVIQVNLETAEFLYESYLFIFTYFQSQKTFSLALHVIKLLISFSSFNQQDIQAILN